MTLYTKKKKKRNQLRDRSIKRVKVSIAPNIIKCLNCSSNGGGRNEAQNYLCDEAKKKEKMFIHHTGVYTVLGIRGGVGI
jgi:hypothetical protein